MTLKYRFNWEPDNTLWVEFFGAIDAMDLNNATNAFYNDPRLETTKQVLWDFSAIESFDVSQFDAEEIAYTDQVESQYKKDMKAAFITQDATFAELARKYINTLNSLSCAWQNRLFNRIEDARQWISNHAAAQPTAQAISQVTSVSTPDHP